MSVLTLGCKVNQTESQALLQLMTDHGHEVDDKDPDVLIVNTCTVTETSSGKSRRLIRRLGRELPGSRIVVMGCYAQMKWEEVRELPGVDMVLGTQNRSAVLQYLERLAQGGVGSAGDYFVPAYTKEAPYEEMPLLRHESRTRAMVKIQDGCGQYCSYCIVPYARGPSRSRKPQAVLAEAGSLLAAGYRELVLTGIHIGAYGKDLSDDVWDLCRLVEEIAALPGLLRLRLGSLEPLECDGKLVETVCRYPSICRHLHIPLQSGSDAVLARMGRPYTTGDYRNILSELRRRDPLIAVAADVMVGFPGETQEEYEESFRFVQECGFANLHVFPYSRREGTRAAAMPGQLESSVKKKRAGEMIALGERSAREYRRLFVGRELEFLVERRDMDENGCVSGYTGNYLALRVPFSEVASGLKPGDLVKCIVKKEYMEDVL